MKIGNAIRIFRHLKKMTHKEVAFQLGITQQAYSKIERDESSISVERLIDIADVLEVDIKQILNYSSTEETIAAASSENSLTPANPSLPSRLSTDRLSAKKLQSMHETITEENILWKIIEYQREEMEVLRNEKMELLKMLQQLDLLKKL
ncbi:helix-turn-helix transcriptional regulator [Xanthocytophaga agilis]|uniref:Helix-turn-helix transcriptional regulator n=1 Tax=Xanthocytophaga agilis TaxID=3048010 RepID=A0AAE3R5G2_9BACT|nr:helix-turn-helix transcriptional regulator [Xanthocytophaga agilis]MDJ1501173.1 helix-turn-helix transcriptional regulator [Xanthocytophaga agilis]